MRSVDTNILLRVILEDDVKQLEPARQVIASPCFVSLGVLIETGWVLRSTYGLGREAIAAALTTITDISSVHVPDPTGVRWALDRYRNHKADLADMLHIVAGKTTTAFVSFEKHLGKQAGADTPLPIERPA